MLQLQKDWKHAGIVLQVTSTGFGASSTKHKTTSSTLRNLSLLSAIRKRKRISNSRRRFLKKLRSSSSRKNRAATLNNLKGFSEEWRAIGFVPRKNMDEFVSSFSKAMDAHYDALSADRSERSVANYSDRVERLAKAGSRDIKREQSILRDKINRLNSKIASTEENMARFTGKGAQSIVDQAEKTIKGYKREIDEIKAKLKLLREAAAEQSN